MEEESVYNLIPDPQITQRKPPMYRSTHTGKVNPAEFELGVSKRKSSATMGRPIGAVSPCTTQFLRSHEKEPVLPEPAAPSQPKHKVRPPVPSKEEAPVMGLTSNKNFITTNAVDVILSKPKQPPHDLVYTAKPGYGEVPRYLGRNKDRIAYEKAELENYMKLRSNQEAPGVLQLPEEERQELLRHLKNKWASVNSAYQKMTFTLDTAAQKKRKEQYERQLGEIEKDIKTLERGEVVLVTDN